MMDRLRSRTGAGIFSECLFCFLDGRVVFAISSNHIRGQHSTTIYHEFGVSVHEWALVDAFRCGFYCYEKDVVSVTYFIDSFNSFLLVRCRFFFVSGFGTFPLGWIFRYGTVNECIADLEEGFGFGTLITR